MMRGAVGVWVAAGIHVVGMLVAGGLPVR